MKLVTGVITGGAGHIGQAISKKLASQGVIPIIIDKNKDLTSKLIEELKKIYKIEAFEIIADLNDRSSFTSIQKEIEYNFDRIDFVVNNAAFYDSYVGWGVPFEEEGYEAWMKVMQVNLFAPFFLTQKLFSLIEKSERASIVNISSIYGIVGPDHRIYEGLGMTNPAAYSASKGGLIQLTRWLSTKLAPKIRVNCISPGGIKRDQDPIFIERYKNKTPLQKMATEADVANAVSFLISEESSYMTGQNLVIDGGWSVW